MKFRMKMFILSGIFLFSSAYSENAVQFSIKDKDPLCRFSPEEIKNGKVEGKTVEYLSKYAELELKAPNDKLAEKMNEKYGDFGIPAELPDNKELIDFLMYSADHYRTSYLHLGKEPDRKNIAPIQYVGAALRDLWLYHNDENARKKYEIILRHALRNIENKSDEEIISKIDERGLMNLWHPLMKSAALYYAQLYAATGDEHFAQRTCLILKRFGEVIGGWKIYCKNRAKNEVKIFSTDKPLPVEVNYGLWGYWGDVHDLNHALPLLEAYLLIKNSKSFAALSDENKKIISEKLLSGLVEKHLLFKFRPLHNQNMNRIKGMAYFGKFLNRPEYIHATLRWIRDILHIGFRSDGMWCEGTVAYGFPVARGIMETADFLNGYSDPSEYIDPVDKTHIENFNPEKEFGYDFNRIKAAFDLLALPDGRSVAFEDSTWNAKGMFFGNPPIVSKSFLMGASGKGMLGFGKGEKQVRLYSQWEGTNNHDHYSNLELVLWACNEEISSETGYRGLRDWNISTAAHNTVVVDEKNQSAREHKNKNPDDRLPLYPEYVHKDLWGVGALYDDGGSLRLWDMAEKGIQIAEIDANKSYSTVAGTKVYMRTLAMVKIDDERFYVLDIFRVKGGKIHDYMLHGNLAKPYKIKISADKEAVPDKLKIGKYLESISAGKKNSENFAVEFSDDGGSVLRTVFAGGTEKDIIIAQGPAIRLDNEPSSWGKPGHSPVTAKSGKTSEFLCVRHNGPETIFIAVHEAYKKDEKPIVRDIELLKVKSQNSLDVGIKVKLENREDIFISSIDSNTNIEYENISFSGNFLHAVTEKGNVKEIRVYGAEKLSWDKFHLDKPTISKGAVYSIESKSRGGKNNSFTVEGILPEKDKLKGSIIIIYDGQKRPHPYIISEIENLPGDKSKVIVSNESGFIMNDESMTMLYYPCWKIPGKPSYIIKGKHILNAENMKEN